MSWLQVCSVDRLTVKQAGIEYMALVARPEVPVETLRQRRCFRQSCSVAQAESVRVRAVFEP